MAKKFKKSAVLGSQMAPSGNGPVTGGFQLKNDFFGPESVLTPLTALETPTNLWKHLVKCQYLTQDTDSTKNGVFRVFLALGLTSINWRNGVKNWIFNVCPCAFDQSRITIFILFVDGGRSIFKYWTISTWFRVGKNKQKRGILKNKQKVSFPPVPNHRIWSFQELKTLQKGQFLVLSLSWVRYWHMAKCFPRFVGVSREVKGVRTKLGPKSHF